MPDANGNPLPEELEQNPQETAQTAEESEALALDTAEPAQTMGDPDLQSTDLGGATPTALSPAMQDYASGEKSFDPSDLLQMGAERRGQDTMDYADYESGVSDIDAISDKIGGQEKYMTPETTVAGQLERLLGKESPIEQQARVEARGQASALGMMSSSGAIGAARRASIKALTPVAMKDAETARQFQQQKQAVDNEISKIQVEAEVSGDLTQQKATIQEQSKLVDQEWQAMMTGLDGEQKAWMAGIQEQINTRMKNLEGDISRELKQQDIDASVEQQLTNQFHESMNNYQITIQQLLANDSFLDNFAGNQAAMHGLFNDLLQTVESDMILAAKATGVYPEMEGYISEMVADNTW